MSQPPVSSFAPKMAPPQPFGLPRPPGVSADAPDLNLRNNYTYQIDSIISRQTGIPWHESPKWDFATLFPEFSTRQLPWPRQAANAGGVLDVAPTLFSVLHGSPRAAFAISEQMAGLLPDYVRPVRASEALGIGPLALGKFTVDPHGATVGVVFGGTLEPHHNQFSIGGFMSVPGLGAGYAGWRL